MVIVKFLEFKYLDFPKYLKLFYLSELYWVIIDKYFMFLNLINEICKYSELYILLNIPILVIKQTK
jgi:hypothetical protein